MVNSMREWDLEFVEEWLPLYIREAVIGCPPPWDLGRPDILAWNLSNDGEFSLWSAYVAVARHQYKPDPPIFRSIWNWSGPERIKLLLWRVSKSVLLTNDEWSKRGLTMDASCPRCNASLESIPHVLRDFPVATAVWMEILHISVTDPFFRTDFFGCRETLDAANQSIGALPSELSLTSCGDRGMTWFSTIKAGTHMLWLVWCTTPWWESGVHKSCLERVNLREAWGILPLISSGHHCLRDGLR